MSYAIIIANPVSSSASRAKIEKAVSVMGSAGLRAEVLYTAGRGDAERFARDSAEKGPAFVMAAGGDGTFNEVANGLVGTGVPMALLPVGSMNVLARELGIPLDAGSAARAALERSPRAVSLGRVSAEEQVRYFCLMAGIGFDAMAVANVNLGVKRISGVGAYVLSGLKGLLAWSPEELSLKLDGHETTAYMLIVCNTSRYAGELRVAPDAYMESPDLYAYLMHGGRRTDVLRYAYGIITGKHLKMGRSSYVRARRIEVSGRADIQVDGDYLGTSPAVITVEPAAISIIH